MRDEIRVDRSISPVMVNLGCGKCYNSAWVNIDVDDSIPDIHVYDLHKGIPMADSSCDVLYQSNIIEHFNRSDASFLIKECYRVLRVGGILRVATPNIEDICKRYLDMLNEVKRKESDENIFNYEWMILELIDQFSRDSSGGEMVKYLSFQHGRSTDFILKRIGVEGQNIINSLNANNSDEEKHFKEGLMCRFKEFVRKKLLLRLLGEKGNIALHLGLFRMSGEVHRWAYDSYSLSALLRNGGFESPVICLAGESEIDNWESYNLELLENGTIIKPDSMYMEVRK